MLEPCAPRAWGCRISVDTKLTALIGRQLCHSAYADMHGGAWAAMGFDGLYLIHAVGTEKR